MKEQKKLKQFLKSILSKMAKGFQKGYTPWNKGKKMSLEFGKKISKAMKGRKGRNWTEEEKRKQSKKLKGNTNKRGKKCSEETKRKMSRKAKTSERIRIATKNLPKARKGSASPSWKGGAKRPYQHTGWRYYEWRTKVFERDNWTCQTCGARSKAREPVYLEAHHIKSWVKYKKLRYELSNGVTLCRECHKLIHKKHL